MTLYSVRCKNLWATYNLTELRDKHYDLPVVVRPKASSRGNLVGLDAFLIEVSLYLELPGR
jgi:hypothetical protein